MGKYKFKDGYLFNFAKNYSPPRYVLSGEESCKFTVGRCEFKSYDGKVSYMYTEYRDGMWIRNVPGFRLSRSLNIDVYDSQGFPVYRFHKSLKVGIHMKNIESRVSDVDQVLNQAVRKIGKA